MASNTLSQPSRNAILDGLDESEARVAEIESIVVDTDRTLDDDDCLESGTIFDWLGESNGWEKFTGFPKESILDLFKDMSEFVNSGRGRGPRPKTSYMDHLLLLLYFYRTGDGFERSSAKLNMKVETYRNVIDRARYWLRSTLTMRWDPEKHRPTPLEDSEKFEHAALYGDCTSFEVFKPSGPYYREAKKFYDGKNKIYALKKLVSVSAASPHYALFISPSYTGATHDYKVLKENYMPLVEYLRKSNIEKELLVSDHQNDYWSILMDKGFIGPSRDTPNLRRLCPFKPANSSEKRRFNMEQAEKRVAIECFFGKMHKAWGFVRRAYFCDHSTFDVDIDNIILLTNELIKVRASVPTDENRDFYAKCIEIRRSRQEERQKKRKESNDKYRDSRKRLRLTYGN